MLQIPFNFLISIYLSAAHKSQASGSMCNQTGSLHFADRLAGLARNNCRVFACQITCQKARPAEALNHNDLSSCERKTLTHLSYNQMSLDQIQGVDQQQDDSRMQAMAAAMLPLFWPSFQLGSHHRAGSSATTAASNEPVAAYKDGKWLIEYTQLDRKMEAKQEADSDEKAQKVAEEQQQAKVRAKRRKPIYLMPIGGSSGQAASSTPYPESTRLANKYPMPKIKFQPTEAVKADDSAGTTPLTNSSSGASKSSLPKSLSRLIEHQLMRNASSLLMQYRASGAGGLAPSTSVSKVVRVLKTGEQVEGLFDPHRQRPLNSTENPAPASSTPTPSAPATNPPLRPKLKPTLLPKPPATTTARPKRQTTTSTPEPTTPTPTTIAPTTTTSPVNVTRRRPLVKSAVRSTEPSTAYRGALPPPTTSTRRPALDEPEGSNKILPDEDEQREQEQKEPPAGAVNKLASKRQRRPFGQVRGGAGGNERNTVKLFHFKRKPDMNKLPFYKKPLNYTELGWTAEQVQQHLANQTSEVGGESALDQQQAQEGELADSRQKRRRRGKNHFERLMAELHATNPNRDDQGAIPENGDEQQAREVKSEQQRQPQKRRAGQQSANNGTADSFVARVAGQKSATGEQLQQQLAKVDEREQQVARANNRSKPIIRKRRKHHGDQQQQWRPSKPLGQGGGWEPAPGERLLLVPSGLLTPSGSHLVPMFAGDDSMSAAEQDGWRPARNDWRKPPLAAMDADPKPSDGIAPSGEESYLQAPGAQVAHQGLVGKRQPAPTQSAAQNQQQPYELRVPKLLMKPLRPAKYSLNGYIPKPSLAQQQQQSAAIATTQTQEQQHLGGPAKTLTTGNLLKPKLRSPTGNKDLVSKSGRFSSD